MYSSATSNINNHVYHVWLYSSKIMEASREVQVRQAHPAQTTVQRIGLVEFSP